MNQTGYPATSPGSKPPDEVRLARAYLLRVAEPPAKALSELVAVQGPVSAAEAVRAQRVPDAVAEETAARRDARDSESALVDAERIGARLVIPEDAEWPAWPLLSLEVGTRRGVQGVSGPLGLWVQGNARLDEVAEQAVAVVGARAATGYGEHTAAELGHGLAAGGVTVFSGAAYGIDGAAHRGALAAGGCTAAVLGCGLDAGYPAGHVGLLERVAGSGLVISEYPQGTPPARHRFLVRNRLIAALTAGTVVVEAGARSGAKNTAGTARVLGKVVMAVPGPISSALSIGCHQMIREADASLVSSVSDVLDAVGRLDVRPESGDSHPRRRTDGLDRHTLRVHEALSARSGKPVEQVAAESGVPEHRVRALLPTLEIDGLSQRCESGWRRTVS